MRSFFIPVPIWQRKVLIIVKGTQKQWLRAISRHHMGRAIRNALIDDPPTIGEAACLYEDETYGRYVIYFNKWDADTLGHEVTHLTRKILKHVGARNDEEANGYTFEWLNKEIKKRLRTVKKHT